jgi:NADPH:quinone reductase
MVYGMRIHETGAPEVMRWEPVEVGEPGRGEVRVRHTAAGVNYVDCLKRSGNYAVPLRLPSGIGDEGAGIVEVLGSDVTDLKVGDRVAYAGWAGSYAEARIIAADRLVKIPDGIAEAQAAAMMLKGLTARYLLRRTYSVQPGDTILFHAVAGGLGLIACQWAKHLGATVIGTVSSDAKAAIAKAHGCDHVIVYTRQDFVQAIREVTGGGGVHAVYDGVGRDTFHKSLDCLRPRGIIVSIGQTSGPIPPLDVATLAPKGSLYLARTALVHHTATRAELVQAAEELFAVVLDGAVKIEVNQNYPLRDAVRAHADLEQRRTTGSSILTV